MSKNKKPPFNDDFEDYISLWGMDPHDAVERIQSRYDYFKNRNQKLIERQDDNSNTAQIQLLSHFATLATLTLTVSGFLISLAGDKIKGWLAIIFMSVIIAEIISVVFGAIDFLQTIYFHRKWALAYQEVEKEVEEKFEEGSIVRINELGQIESKRIRRLPKTTRMWITVCMISFCFLGLILLVILFAGYFATR